MSCTPSHAGSEYRSEHSEAITTTFHESMRMIAVEEGATRGEQQATRSGALRGRGSADPAGIPRVEV